MNTHTRNGTAGAAALVSVVFVAALLTGCGTFAGTRQGYPGVRYEEARDYAGIPEAESKAAAPAPAAPMALSRSAGGAFAADAAGNAASQPASNEPAGGRMRIYSGSGRLLVDRPDETRQEIVRTAEAAGGYLESVYGTTVTVRVPAARFSELFERFLSLGEVLGRSVESYDVTEQFTDLTARLEVARLSRDRLYLLLERTEDVRERIRILREITRLNEEIERIENTLAMIESAVAFSRITLELVPRIESSTGMDRPIPFDWIASLNPLYGSIASLKGAFELPLGPEFAVFDRETSFRAETADGVRIRAGSIRNRPEGSAEFWQRALLYHLAPYYRSAEQKTIGELHGAVFTSKDQKPFTYFVGVLTRGTELYVAEVFFPSAESLGTHETAVETAFAGLEVRP